jgi:hypothetical protein
MTHVQVDFDIDVFATLRRSPKEVVQEMRLAAASASRLTPSGAPGVLGWW